MAPEFVLQQLQGKPALLWSLALLLVLLLTFFAFLDGSDLEESIKMPVRAAPSLSCPDRNGLIHLMSHRIESKAVIAALGLFYKVKPNKKVQHTLGHIFLVKEEEEEGEAEELVHH